MVLERATVSPALTPQERAAVERRAAGSRRDAKLARAVEALASEAPEARSLALSIARTQGVPVSTRVRAAAAARRG
jgi:DNA repair photolyase